MISIAASSRRTPTERTTSSVGRLCTAGLYVVAALLSYGLESAQDAFEILISIGAGTGLLYLLRWFWWRINAWTEVVAMISVVRGVGHLLRHAQDRPRPAVREHGADLGRADNGRLADRGVHQQADQPGSADRVLHARSTRRDRAGAVIREAAGISVAEAARHSDHMGNATLGWVSGCAVIWSSLFAIGNFLYGRTDSRAGR